MALASPYVEALVGFALLFLDVLLLPVFFCWPKATFAAHATAWVARLKFTFKSPPFAPGFPANGIERYWH